MSKLVMAGQRLTGEGFAGPHSGHRTPLPGTEVHSTGRGITAGAVLREYRNKGLAAGLAVQRATVPTERRH